MEESCHQPQKQAEQNDPKADAGAHREAPSSICELSTGHKMGTAISDRKAGTGMMCGAHSCCQDIGRSKPY